MSLSQVVEQHLAHKADEEKRLAEQAKNFPVTRLPYIAPRRRSWYTRHVGHAQDRNAVGGRKCNN